MVWVAFCPTVTLLFNCLCKSIEKWLGLFPRGGFNALIWFSRAGYVSWLYCCSLTQGTVFSSSGGFSTQSTTLMTCSYPLSDTRAPESWSWTSQCPWQWGTCVCSLYINQASQVFCYSSTKQADRSLPLDDSFRPCLGRRQRLLGTRPSKPAMSGHYGTSPGKLAAARTAKICSFAWWRKKLIILVSQWD